MNALKPVNKQVKYAFLAREGCFWVFFIVFCVLCMRCYYNYLDNAKALVIIIYTCN